MMAVVARLRTTNIAPDLNSCQKPVIPSAVSVAALPPRSPTTRSVPNEATKDNESSRIAQLMPTAKKRRDPRAGPRMPAVLADVCNNPLARGRSSTSTRLCREATDAGLKNCDAALERKTMPYMTPSVSVVESRMTAASATRGIRSARSASIQSITRRLFQRSTKTPATGASTTAGAELARRTPLTARGERCAPCVSTVATNRTTLVSNVKSPTPERNLPPTNAANRALMSGPTFMLSCTSSPIGARHVPLAFALDAIEMVPNPVVDGQVAQVGMVPKPGFSC